MRHHAGPTLARSPLTSDSMAFLSPGESRVSDTPTEMARFRLTVMSAAEPTRRHDTGSSLSLVVVQDEPQWCPYLNDRMARMPLELPIARMRPEQLDDVLASGYRRSGNFVYRTQCPDCCQCRPTRVDPRNFPLRSSFRRVLRRGESHLCDQWAPPSVDSDRVALFNTHRDSRQLGGDDRCPVTPTSYRSFLVDSCCDTLELSMRCRRDGRLLGIAIVDVGRTSLSAVYTHFHPDASRLSIGTYAILRQIQWAADRQMRWVYLGMYVADNPHLNYKARFTPQERLIDGRWVTPQ